MQEQNNLGLSVAIVIAAIIIGGAVYFTNKNNPAPTNNRSTDTSKITDVKPIDPSNISPVTSADHIRGDINAKIKIVEYSDTECPFCIRLHSTLHQIVKESPDVAWVYRHMPLTQLHQRAINEAVATECVAEIGGEEKFWEYLDMIYAKTPGNDRLDPALLSQFAIEVGVDKTTFESCLSSGRHLDKVKSQVAEGASAGAQGTPFSIIITPKGEYLPVVGAQPIEVWRNAIELVLNQK